MVLPRNCNKCLICRKLVKLTRSKHEKADIISKETSDVFTAWKNECATAICHVLFGKSIYCIVNYLQKANYCSGCEQLVRDVSYAWKQIQLFQHRISDLSTKMCTLIDSNYQMIEEKSRPEITQKRISFLLVTTSSVKLPGYSYEEMVEIIYSVLSSSLKRGLKKDFGCSNASPRNHVETCTDPAFRFDHSSSQYFDIVDEIKEDLSDNEQFTQLESAVVEDPLFIEGMDNSPQIKPENCNSHFDECNESVEDFENSEDISEEKYTSDDSNSSSEYEVTKQKPKRGRPPLKHRDKLKNSKKYPYIRKRPFCEEEGCGKTFANEANKRIHILKVHKGESQPFKCPQLSCEGKFTSAEHLKRHMKRKHEEGNVKNPNNCTFCGVKYVEPVDLLSHYSTSHQEPNPFLCAFCPELFQNTLDLTAHTKQSHHQSNVCETCGKVFINVSLLNNHVLKNHAGNVLCSVCGKKFNNKLALRMHMRTHNEPKSYKCEVCHEEFKFSTQLNSHMDLHKEGEFTCKVCEKILPSLYDLNVHESTHKSKETLECESEKPKDSVNKKVRPISYNFHCKFCSKGYIKEEELNDHYAVAHLGPNPFTCAFCPNVCSNSVDLSIHVKSAHPDPNFSVGKLKCDKCDRYFSSGPSLSMHKKRHLDPSLLLKCNLCSAVFKTNFFLKVHMETHSEVRKYVCTKCGKAYKSYQSQYRHSRTHDEKERKYPCKICGKKFFTTLNCKNHERCHTDIKEFVCHICGKGFNRDWNLTEHLKIHAGLPIRRRRPKINLKPAEKNHKPT